MYRLVAQHFVEEGHVVAIPGYRVYPDGTIDHQVEDFAQAIRKLETLYTNYKMTIIGHSSGAHVALLTLIRSIQQPSSNTHKPFHQLIDSFIGLSGPYDIGHHFDYEAARGVEEISPMKPVNGYTRRNFEHNSPARRLQQTLIVLPNETNIHQIMPKMLLVHGMDDSTVPFTATAEAARILRSCGVFCVREAYLAGVNHSDTVVEIMRGGHTRQAIEEWIIQLDGERVGTDLEGIDRVTNPVLVVQSRL
jgi:acetyl esterase/lipase